MDRLDRLSILVVFAAVHLTCPVFATADECTELFLATHSNDRFISYLSQLLENNDIGDHELVTLREGLARGGLPNPIPHNESAYGPIFETSARRIQYNVIQKHLQSGAIDRTSVQRWLEQKLEQRSGVRERREAARVETQDIYRKMEFYPIPPGEFEMGKAGQQVKITLTHSIEMMSTPITQKMWVDVMGENPSKYKNGPESVEIEINGKNVRMRPDHPVEYITWWSMIVFANRLSERAGLKPAYDLSEIEFTGRAENGTLKKVTGKLKIMSRDGDIYQAEGFRLPTEAEQEYVLRDLGRAKGLYPHDLTEAELENYGWFEDASGGDTHAVGTTLKSLSINGKLFDDLIGNVWELSHDYSGDYAASRGGSHNNTTRDLCSHRHCSVDTNGQYANVGARLVRTVKK